MEIESTQGKFKQSSIRTDNLDGEAIELDPYRMIEEAEEIRKRKFVESSSKSVLRIRPSLNIH